MSTHNIDFYDELTKLPFSYPKLSPYTPLIQYSYFSYLIFLKVNILPTFFFFFFSEGGVVFSIVSKDWY